MQEPKMQAIFFKHYKSIKSRVCERQAGIFLIHTKSRAKWVCSGVVVP